MANVSLYVSGQTEQVDVAEFFQKGLMGAGESPIAFFEGVFYESHQERVGNIAFQDYLVYTDKAVYLWARGSSKDYLDRFNLGSVSVNSRNKDYDFATLNLKVRREDKEPVYVIFDMVELREAELIIRLHTVIESIIEENLGLNYRKNLPDKVSLQILQASRGVCIPQSFSFRFDVPDPEQQGSHIGYGQDLLEQYKASLGYPPSQDPPRQQAGEKRPEGFSAADAIKGIENLLPTDPAALKKVAESIKDIIGDAPFKIRDQLKNDLQHVPGMLTALNELVNSIADNPQAERFVINIVKTAVKNDGMISSVGKLLRLSTSFGDSSKRRGQRSAPRGGVSDSKAESSSSRNHDFGDESDAFSRRKKIKIKSDDEATLNDDCFNSLDSGFENERAPASPSGKVRRVDDSVESDIPARKSIAIQSLDDDIPALVKKMMSVDDFPEGAVDSIAPGNGDAVARKKITIKADSGESLHSSEKDVSASQSDG
ncbi:MAG: hypothetical protein WCI64_01965 [Chlorobium sp.]